MCSFAALRKEAASKFERVVVVVVVVVVHVFVATNGGRSGTLI